MTADISIVIASVGRASLVRAVQSIFHQAFEGNIQILIGLDVDFYGHAQGMKTQLEASCPKNMFMTWIDPGYSTSKRHGGVHRCFYGGALRSALSFLAQSQYVMYLDDDDWIGESHCADVLKAIQDKKWAHSLCFYADGNSGEAICEDLLESVGVNAGIYKDDFGGFVRASGLLINKIALANLLYIWSESNDLAGDGEDRLVFEQLRHIEHGCTGRASVYYTLDPKDSMHAVRMQYINSQGGAYQSAAKIESVR
jgi:hypothetical protein